MSGRNEHGFWVALRKKLKEIRHIGHVVRVENGVGPGTPDLNYAFPYHNHSYVREGWLELKCITHCPRSDKVLLPHFTPAQRLWMKSRVEAGGHVKLLLKVESEDKYFLLSGYFCVHKLGKCSRVEIEEECDLCFAGLTADNVRELINYL